VREKELFENFRKNLYWNMKLVICVVMGAASISALYYLGTAADVLGGHH
jgi:hypothetical protein